MYTHSYLFMKLVVAIKYSELSANNTVQESDEVSLLKITAAL